ncbi:MAG: HAD family phosphatase [Ignavibacteria bacterium]|nr:HAD family phosphatase [Ignavibacteria bacterium]
MKIEVPEFIRGLIFDCDGTLVDSMPLHIKAWEFAITDSGLNWDFEFFDSKKGMPSNEILELYSKHYNADINIDKVLKTKYDYFYKHRTEFKPIEHVVDIVFEYKDKLPMSVASGGSRKTVNVQLDDLGIRHLFKAIITADDNLKSKPAPDMFLEAARRMNVEPQFCQVFEDGEFGLEAARKAGMLATDIRLFNSE